MKKTISILFLSLLLTGAGSCIKDTGCQDKTLISEQAAITGYATANGITATAHSSGIYYEIINPGSGATANLNSTVKVNYVGKYVSNGTIFDQTTVATGPVSFVLGGVIPGWQLGIPLIQKGGSIKLIIPSSLAYGCSGRSPIPSNAILYFEIELLDVL